MEIKSKKEHVTFPLKLLSGMNKRINTAVIKTDAESKHQYIVDAIMDKVKKDLGE